MRPDGGGAPTDTTLATSTPIIYTRNKRKGVQMPAFSYLTDAQARAMPRAKLLDRLEAQWEHYHRKTRKTPADENAMHEASTIMHRYLSPRDAIAAARAAVEGDPTDYWESRPCDDPEEEP